MVMVPPIMHIGDPLAGKGAAASASYERALAASIRAESAAAAVASARLRSASIAAVHGGHQHHNHPHLASVAAVPPPDLATAHAYAYSIPYIHRHALGVTPHTLQASPGRTLTVSPSVAALIAGTPAPTVPSLYTKVAKFDPTGTNAAASLSRHSQAAMLHAMTPVPVAESALREALAADAHARAAAEAAAKLGDSAATGMLAPSGYLRQRLSHASGVARSRIVTLQAAPPSSSPTSTSPHIVEALRKCPAAPSSANNPAPKMSNAAASDAASSCSASHTVATESAKSSLSSMLQMAKDATSGPKPTDCEYFINDIRPKDVLCGRGGKSNHHPGNKRYRHVVSEMKKSYRSIEAKSAKTDLSRAIVEHVYNYGGRFVKKDKTTGRFYVLTMAEARKKTSQALRECKQLKWIM